MGQLGLQLHVLLEIMELFLLHVNLAEAQLVREATLALRPAMYTGQMEIIQKTCWIPLIDDNYVEGTESINVTLINPTGGAIVGSSSTTHISIIDNEPCSGANVVFDGVVFQSGKTISCSGSNSVSARDTIIQNGANVHITAPVITLQDGFHAYPGFTAKQ